MFKHNIQDGQLIFCYNSFYKIKHHQKFVYLTKTKENDITKSIILDVGVKFTFNDMTYKIIKIKNWFGIISCS